jgi:hypothetical protein
MEEHAKVLRGQDFFCGFMRVLKMLTIAQGRGGSTNAIYKKY